MTVGERIKDIREGKNISQVDLAKRVGISKQTLYKYERNIVTNIPLDVVEKIANALMTDPSHLMGWDASSNTGSNSGERLFVYAKSLLRQLDDEDIRTISDQMEFMLSRDKYKKGATQKIS